MCTPYQNLFEIHIEKFLNVTPKFCSFLSRSFCLNMKKLWPLLNHKHYFFLFLLLAKLGIWSGLQNKVTDCKCIHFVFSEDFCILRKHKVEWGGYWPGCVTLRTS